jgi:hypothetical protein
MVDIFAKVGVGRCFRIVNGLHEVTGALLLVVPRFTFCGALLLLVIMMGAVTAHLTAVGGISRSCHHPFSFLTLRPPG